MARKGTALDHLTPQHFDPRVEKPRPHKQPTLVQDQQEELKSQDIPDHQKQDEKYAQLEDMITTLQDNLDEAHGKIISLAEGEIYARL